MQPVTLRLSRQIQRRVIYQNRFTILIVTREQKNGYTYLRAKIKPHFRIGSHLVKFLKIGSNTLLSLENLLILTYPAITQLIMIDELSLSRADRHSFCNKSYVSFVK